MTSIKPIRDRPVADPFFVEDYEYDDERTMEVYIDDTHIPVVDEGVRVEFRKDGPADITGLVEGKTWGRAQDNAYHALLSADNVTGYRSVRVDLRDALTDEMQTVFDGFLSSYGPDDPDGKLRFTARDPAQLLSEIPASVSFRDATGRDIYQYVVDTFVDEQPLFDECELVFLGADEQVIFAPTLEEIILPNDNEILPTKLTPREFTANKHTLLDVLKFVRERTNTRYYFDRTTDGALALVVGQPAGPRTFSPFSDSQATSLDIIENNLLFDIQPRNAITVKGDAVSTRSTPNVVSVFNVEQPTTRFYEATAEYEPLVERAGGTLSQTTVNVNAASEGGVERAARSKLKDLLDNSAAGEMVTRLKPSLLPYQTIEARPVDRGVTNTDVSPLTYEAKRVVHHATVTEYPRTEVTATLHVDPTKIEVVDEQWRDA